MNYLININNTLHEYNNLEVLLIDIKMQNPESYQVFERVNEGLKFVYKLTTYKDLREQLA